jgi:hypothetical protein
MSQPHTKGKKWGRALDRIVKAKRWDLLTPTHIKVLSSMAYLGGALLLTQKTVGMTKLLSDLDVFIKKCCRAYPTAPMGEILMMASHHMGTLIVTNIVLEKYPQKTAKKKARRK